MDNCDYFMFIINIKKNDYVAMNAISNSVPNVHVTRVAKI